MQLTRLEKILVSAFSAATIFGLGVGTGIGISTGDGMQEEINKFKLLQDAPALLEKAKLTRGQVGQAIEFLENNPAPAKYAIPLAIEKAQKESGQIQR